MKIFATAGLILALVAGAAGQAGLGTRRVTGTVVYEDGTPVAGAQVSVTLIESESIQSRMPLVPKAKTHETSFFETTADRKGRWVLAGLASAKWEIRAASPGCVDTIVECDLSRISRNPRVKIRLEKIKEGSYAADPAALGRANELFQRGEYDRARTLYESYLVKDPGAIAVMTIIGDCWRNAGDRLRAMEAYQLAVRKASTDPGQRVEMGTALGKIGECSLEDGRRELALDFLGRAAAILPGNIAIRAELGDLLCAMDRPGEAVRHFLAAIEIEPGNALLRFRLGLVHLSLADTAAARDSFSKVIELDAGSDLARQARDFLAAIKDKKTPDRPRPFCRLDRPGAFV